MQWWGRSRSACRNVLLGGVARSPRWTCMLSEGCLIGLPLHAHMPTHMVPEGRLIGLPTAFGFALVEAHFGMWRSATSASNLRPQCGQAVRRSSGSSRGGGGASPFFHSVASLHRVLYR